MQRTANTARPTTIADIAAAGATAAASFNAAENWRTANPDSVDSIAVRRGANNTGAIFLRTPRYPNETVCTNPAAFAEFIAAVKAGAFDDFAN